MLVIAGMITLDCVVHVWFDNGRMLGVARLSG